MSNNRKGKTGRNVPKGKNNTFTWWQNREYRGMAIGLAVFIAAWGVLIMATTPWSF